MCVVCGADVVQSSQSFDFLLSALSACNHDDVAAIVGGTVGGGVVVIVGGGSIAGMVVYGFW